jgi:hypothetical protein
MAYDPSDLESFDVDEVKALRKSTENNQPSNPYIRKGMGVLNFVNDFNPAVALTKTADSVTSDVNKGDYKGALGTLALEAAMSNPVTKALGKAYKKIRGKPTSSYGGPLSMRIHDLEDNGATGYGQAERLLRDQMTARGEDPDLYDWFFHGINMEKVAPELADDIAKGGKLAGRNDRMVYVAGDSPVARLGYGDELNGTYVAGAVPKGSLDKYKMDVKISGNPRDTKLTLDEINEGKKSIINGRNQWRIHEDELDALRKEAGYITVPLNNELGIGFEKGYFGGRDVRDLAKDTPFPFLNEYFKKK